MKSFIRTTLALIVAQLAAAALAQQAPGAQPEAAAPPVIAEKGNILRLQLSAYTWHFNPDPLHERVVLAGVEREHPNGKLDGIALFSNSFGQESVYIFPWGGVYKEVWGVKHLSFKWTAGLLYGYKEPYENKVPGNYKGFSPGLIPALAYEFRPGWEVQANILGTAGVMFQLNVPLN